MSEKSGEGCFVWSIWFMAISAITTNIIQGCTRREDLKRIESIETQLAHDANCIATLEVLQQAREEREAK